MTAYWSTLFLAALFLAPAIIGLVIGEFTVIGRRRSFVVSRADSPFDFWFWVAISFEWFSLLTALAMWECPFLESRLPNLIRRSPRLGSLLALSLLPLAILATSAIALLVAAGISGSWPR